MALLPHSTAHLPHSMAHPSVVPLLLVLLPAVILLRAILLLKVILLLVVILQAAAILHQAAVILLLRDIPLRAILLRACRSVVLPRNSNQPSLFLFLCFPFRYENKKMTINNSRVLVITKDYTEDRIK